MQQLFDDQTQQVVVPDLGEELGDDARAELDEVDYIAVKSGIRRLPPAGAIPPRRRPLFGHGRRLIGRSCAGGPGAAALDRSAQ
jgi:hypothetical protein